MSWMKQILFFLAIFFLLALVSACAPVNSAVEDPIPLVTPEAAAGQDGVVDLEPFKAELLRAIAGRDQAALEKLMTERFYYSWWRGEMGNYPRADALIELFRDQLGGEVKLSEVASSELSALMGGIDPLAILPAEENVTSLIFVTGWGKEGEDEAMLFVSRQPDDTLRWIGTMVIKGGFTSPETGGVQALVNAQHGYQMYLPRGYEVPPTLSNEITIVAPQGSAEGHLGRATISVEPANGRTLEQIVEYLKQTVLSDVASQPGTVIGLDSETALVFDRVPSQSLMRVVFTVHEDRLYRMNFFPQDEAEGVAYDQMTNLYAVITNTFKFIPVVGAEGKLVAEPEVFVQLLQQGLAEHDKAALQSMMGDRFALTFRQSEGMLVTPDEAIQQILNNYAPQGAQLVFNLNDPRIASLYTGPQVTESGEELIPVYVSGWGLEGKDEAVLLIARRVNGSLYWYGALTAIGGFGQ